jgi:hypothetical protein
MFFLLPLEEFCIGKGVAMGEEILTQILNELRGLGQGQDETNRRTERETIYGIIRKEEKKE